MLTCVNHAVTFKLKVAGNQNHYKGTAVALKWLLPLVRQFGGSHPHEDRIRQEIKSLSIGDGRGDKKQFFNKYPNGKVISRGADGVETVARSCVVIRQTSFGQEKWRLFSEGKHIVNQLLHDYRGFQRFYKYSSDFQSVNI